MSSQDIPNNPIEIAGAAARTVWFRLLVFFLLAAVGFGYGQLLHEEDSFGDGVAGAFYASALAALHGWGLFPLGVLFGGFKQLVCEGEGIFGWMALTLLATVSLSFGTTRFEPLPALCGLGVALVAYGWARYCQRNFESL